MKGQKRFDGDFEVTSALTYLEYFLKFDKTNYFKSKSRPDFSSLSKATLITNLVDGFFK